MVRRVLGGVGGGGSEGVGEGGEDAGGGAPASGESDSEQVFEPLSQIDGADGHGSDSSESDCERIFEPLSQLDGGNGNLGTATTVECSICHGVEPEFESMVTLDCGSHTAPHSFHTFCIGKQSLRKTQWSPILLKFESGK